jgi:TonB family protein
MRHEQVSVKGEKWVSRWRTYARRAWGGIMALTSIALVFGTPGCIDKRDAKKMIEALQSTIAPDSLPVMQNTELPFKYPPELYAGKIQGNVTLRIHIDATGAVRPESTTVVESSGFPALDSAAVSGAGVLHFRPAFAKGAPLAISVLFPVYFRHPEASPLPGDTVLKPRN